MITFGVKFFIVKKVGIIQKVQSSQNPPWQICTYALVGSFANPRAINYRSADERVQERRRAACRPKTTHGSSAAAAASRACTNLFALKFPSRIYIWRDSRVSLANIPSQFHGRVQCIGISRVPGL